MIEKTLAKRYAAALLKVTDAEGSTEETESLLLALKDAYNSQKEFRAVLSQPRVPRAMKKRLQAILDDAAKTRTQLLADAHAQVEGALDKAKREIAIERDKAVLELRHEATDLTLRAADQLVQSTMNDALQEKLVAKYLTELDGVKKT